METCCEPQENQTTVRTFVLNGVLYTTVNGIVSVADLSNLIGGTTTEITRYIIPTNGQNIFTDAFPNDETFLSLTVGIEHILDIDFEVVNQNIVWISDIPLSTTDRLIIKTQKSI